MYWRRATTLGVVVGLLAGVATAFFFYMNPELKPYDMHEGILGLLVHIPVLIGASLLTKEQNADHIEEFFS